MPNRVKQSDDDESYRENLLSRFNLDHIRKNKVKTLSGGELKKLEFCLCMALKPKLILLDEPFSGLDPKTTKLVLSMVKEMREEGIGFVIVDHRIEELKGLAEQYALLNENKIVFKGDKRSFSR